jgi:hypothetical protein
MAAKREPAESRLQPKLANFQKRLITNAPYCPAYHAATPLKMGATSGKPDGRMDYATVSLSHWFLGKGVEMLAMKPSVGSPVRRPVATSAGDP